jgi:hypothetical protein
MNQLVYFFDEVPVEEAVDNPGADREEVTQPERVPHLVRSTMEELAYRTAIWYNPDGKAVMYYKMTLDGVKAIGIRSEDSERKDNVERMPLSGEEPRLLG